MHGQVPSSKCCLRGTGRRLSGLFGKQPHSVVMLFTGMAFWIVLGIALYKAFRQRSSQPEPAAFASVRSEEHTSELQSLRHLVCRLLLEKKKNVGTLPNDP